MKHLLLTTIAAVVLVGCAKPPPPDISIHLAAVMGNIEAVKQHLAAGTDVEVKDNNGFTPLHIATREVAELLIAKGADVNAIVASGQYQGKTPLDAAIQVNRPEVADLLRKHGGKTKKELEGGEPVAEATTSEPSTAKAPDISIHDAAKAGNIEAVKLHLAAGTDVNAKEDDGVTPLHYAAAKGSKEIAELLIAKGADVNVKDEKYGMTPLLFATVGSHKEVGELLIAKGADVNTKDKRGDTSLDFATHPDNPNKNKTETAGLLRKHGGKYSKIHFAARGGDTEAVKEFLAAGTDVNAKNQLGRTPLHAAAYRGHTVVVELLVANDADVNALSVNGKTPLDWADDKETADLLRKHGGKRGAELKAEGK